MNIFQVCMPVHRVHSVHVDARRVHRRIAESPRNRISGDCELPYGY